MSNGYLDLLEQWLCNIDTHSKNEEGSIEYNNILSQFIENIITSKEWEVHEGEDYIDYDLRINKAFDESNNLRNDEKYYPYPLKKNVDYHYNYVSDALSSATIKTWQAGKNVFIAAGTGKGKNTFIQKQLLKHFGHDGNIIIFENREALMTQQNIRMIEAFDKEAFSYQSTEKYQHENMMVFGRHRNIMIISYQKAALKLLMNDGRFMEFLKNVRYAVFDEVHYLIDDSLFNKGVNIVADYLISVPFHMFNNMNPIPNATKIFMSGTMEEFFILLQKWSPYYQIREYESNIHRIEEKNSDSRLNDKRVIENRHYINEPNSILVMPTDYSYIKPFIYNEYTDLMSDISESTDKWLIFVNTIAQGEELKATLNSRYGENTAVFIHAENKNKEASEFYEELMTQEKVSVKVLIATTVIYNGVNIKDSELRNVVLPVSTMPVIKQLIGRKRMTNSETELNVYFPLSSQSDIKKRFRRCLEKMLSSLDERNSNVFRIATIVNQLFPDDFKFTYVMMTSYNKLRFHFSILAWSKVHFDAMFYLYTLRRYQNAPDTAYVSVLLDGLNISDKMDSVMENYRNSQKDAQQRTKETLQAMLERYVGNPIVDKCINEEYNLIPDFTAEFNKIYKELKRKNFDRQWKNRKRTVSSAKFNGFIMELGLPYCIKIESKDSGKETKKLIVTRKE
ncbi:MAG: DEAD/DEAH box helicase [Ruminococcus sp.]|nr:DEAD/DEAH box helicase [Ruminococcus sp.]